MDVNSGHVPHMGRELWTRTTGRAQWRGHLDVDSGRARARAGTVLVRTVVGMNIWKRSNGKRTLA